MKMTRKIIKFITVSILCSLPVISNAGSEQVGRYMTVSNQPTASQMDLLAQTVQVRFPQNINTVGDATNYLLNFSGYSMVQDSQMSEPLKNMLVKPLPVIDREVGPMSLKNALSILVGSAFNLQQDTVNRTVNFHLKPVYLKAYLANKENKGVV